MRACAASFTVLWRRLAVAQGQALSGALAVRSGKDEEGTRFSSWRRWCEMVCAAKARSARCRGRHQDPRRGARTCQRAALWLRAATARQAKKDVSIPDQKRQGEAWCAARGYELV
jgi:hypothetical protein